MTFTEALDMAIKGNRIRRRNSNIIYQIVDDSCLAEILNGDSEYQDEITVSLEMIEATDWEYQSPEWICVHPNSQ